MKLTNAIVFVIVLATIFIDFLGSFNFNEAVKNFRERIKK